jgi:hypothetical protein
VSAIILYQPEPDKIMRLNGQTATIEIGFVLLPATLCSPTFSTS